MSWTKLTRTNTIFSRAACMVLFCAGKWIFGHLRKLPEKLKKIHAPEGARSQKWGQRAVRGPQAPVGAAKGGVAPVGRLGDSPLPWCPTSTPIYSREAKNPKQKSLFQNPSRSRRHPLFLLGRANLEADLASGEGRSSPSSSPSQIHHPSMTSLHMCE